MCEVIWSPRVRNYIILLIIGTILAWISNVFPQGDWWRDFILNLSAGTYGSTLIYFLIEESIERKSKEEEKQRKKIAYRKLRKPILNQINLLARMYKASTQQPETTPRTLNELFNVKFFEKTMLLDFFKKSPSLVEDINWFLYIESINLSFKNHLERIIDIYAFFLEPNVVRILELLLDSVLLKVSINFSGMHSALVKHGKSSFCVYGQMKDELMEYVGLLLEVINEINPFLEESIGVPENIFQDNT